MGRVPRVIVGANVASHQICLTGGEAHIGLFDVDIAGANRLDLGSQQLDPGRIVLEQMVDVSSFSVAGDNPPVVAHATTLARISTIRGSNWLPAPRLDDFKGAFGLTVGRYRPGTLRTSKTSAT